MVGQGSPVEPPRRVQSVDLLRGLVMVLMTVDHARDFVAFDRFDFTDPNLANGVQFVTRWMTHFCAPAFVFLAGTSAYLAGRRRSKLELSRHLFKRGAWLILVEVTLVTFGWWLSMPDRLTLQVIWAIGVSMIVLSALVHLPRQAIAAIAIAIIALHNSFDSIQVTDGGALADAWRVLHQPGEIQVFGLRAFALYSLVPWIGVMALGYALAPMVMSQPRALWRLGLTMTVGFVVLRISNVYGDPSSWVPDQGWRVGVMTLLATTKYPPSLQFLLMTLGPAFVFLGLVQSTPNRLKPLVIIGRVPLFFYVLHLYVLHAFAVLIGVTQGYDASAIRTSFLRYPDGFGISLLGVYAISAASIALLYPLCARFAAIKATRRHPLLSYL